MFQKLKKNFAKVALVALTMQVVAMLAPAGAMAAFNPSVAVDKTELYKDEQLTITANLENTGDFATFFVSNDGTNYSFVKSYQDGGSDDQDGLANGTFVGEVDYSQFPATATPVEYTTHVYGSSAALTAVSDLTGLIFGSTKVTVEVGYRAPIATITPNVIDQVTTSDLTVKLTTPGNYLSFWGSNDGTNYNFIGSYQEGGVDDLDTLTDGVFTEQYSFAYFTAAGDYRFHIYESAAPMTAVSDLQYLAFASTEQVVIMDVAAPEVTTTFAPVIVNNLGKSINVFFSANENMTVDSFTYEVDGAPFVPADPTLVKADTTDFALFHSVQIPANFFAGATTSLTLNYVAKDKVGNPYVGKVVIPVDLVAPGKVENLVATTNADGSVVLSWTNPAGDYTGLQVKRDGVFLTTLPVGTITYTDTSVTRGTTYSYTVTAFDAAGNETVTAPVQITVPGLQVAAAVSDSTNYTTDSTGKDAGTVTSAANSVDTKGDKDEDKENGLPFWAIVLLVVLAAVGGYLIYNQKPVATPVVAAPKKEKAVAPKKTTPKKKPTTKTKK